MKCRLAVIWYFLLSGASLLFTLCVKSTAWPSSAWLDCSKCWIPVQPLDCRKFPESLKLTDNRNLCCSWSQGSDCRVPSADQWLRCKQGLVASAEPLAGFSIFFLFFIFTEFYMFLIAFSISRFGATAQPANSTYWNLPFRYPKDLTQCQQYIRSMAQCRSLSGNN